MHEDTWWKYFLLYFMNLEKIRNRVWVLFNSLHLCMSPLT